MNPGVIVLARMDSSRFPNKAMALLGHKPLVEWCIDGVADPGRYRTVLATTGRDLDRPLVELAARKGIPCYQGPVEDVAGRIAGCLEAHGLDCFARVNGDSPFVRKELLREGFDLIRERGADLVTNLVPRAFPYGVSVEILRSEVFLACYESLTTSLQREHATSYFYEHLAAFKVCCMPYGGGDDHDVRLVVDTPADLERLGKLLRAGRDVAGLPLPELVRLYREVS
ncbi:MAG: NTP transferase domain-containing protein [Elusimicrobia bacterium]|nr:NTP transferase domain-containing protein [Elusimicrobiota bacterium]